jgi:hypothetical protein
VYQGDGTVCLPCNPCITEPVGACCRSSACTVEVEVCCDNGVFQGAGTACAPGACVGACCDGAACTLTDGAACAAGGGIYHGNGTSCGTDPGNLTTCCPANFNGVGGVSVQDIFDFLSAYFAGQFTADFNHSMSITVQDIFDFLAAYFAGCT